MYCKHCGNEVSISWRLPAKCHSCKTEISYGPTRVLNVLVLVAIALGAVVGGLVNLLLSPLTVFSSYVAFVAAFVGIYLFYQVISAALLRHGTLTSDDLSERRPEKSQLDLPKRKLTAAQQAQLNLSKLSLPPEAAHPHGQAALVKKNAQADRPNARPASPRTAVAPAPAAQAASAAAAPAPAARALGGHVLNYDEVRANDAAGIRELGALSSAIVKEHFDPIIGAEQNDYMIARFNTPQAIADQLANHGYRYFFVCDPDASASAGPAERHVGFLAFYQREPGELYLSKFYLRKDQRGRGLSRDMCRFVVDNARALGCNRITLNVNRDNYQAILAYEHLGFQKIRAEKNPIGNGFYMDDFVYQLRV